MRGGEVDTHALDVNLLPGSTYTWHLDKSQAIVYTFRTSADVVGTQSASAGSSTKSSSKLDSQDIVGSAASPLAAGR